MILIPHYSEAWRFKRVDLYLGELSPYRNLLLGCKSAQSLLAAYEVQAEAREACKPQLNLTYWQRSDRASSLLYVAHNLELLWLPLQ